MLVVRLSKSIGRHMSAFNKGARPVKNTVFNNIRCGLHSGFPVCCVAFWATVWRPMCQSDNRSITRIRDCLLEVIGSIEKARGISWYSDYYDDCIDGFGRIPCPMCLLFSRNTYCKKCNCYFGSQDQLDELILADEEGRISK